MNKSFKPVFIIAVLAVFGAANAQAPAAPAATHTAPAATAPAAPAATPAAPAAAAPAAPKTTAPAAAPAPVATPAPAPAAPAAAAPATPAATHTAPAATHAAPAATPAPAAPAAAPATPAATHAAPAATPAPAAPKTTAAPATAPATPAPAATAPAPAATPAPAAVAPAPEAQPVAKDSAAASAPVAEAQPAPKDSTIVLVVEEPKKKKRPSRSFAIVDVPANFEIQAKKIMPIDSDGFDDYDNLDEWWGRANLMVLTESENFVGKIHLRMYPGHLKGYPISIGGGENDRDGKRDRYGNPEARDIFQLYEAWAWHRGDYVNIKLGRWENTTRFGSKTFGGYIDAKKDQNYVAGKSVNFREKGFMSTYTPENALQFGLNNFSENISLDIALVSGDNHLNRGDLRVYFAFRDLAGLENVDIGIGYRSNVFDEVYYRKGEIDVTHTVDFGFKVPLVKEVGILKNLNLFGEAALIGLDDQIGNGEGADKGGSPKECEVNFPILGGLDFSLHRGLDKLVLEVEYDGDRINSSIGKKRGEKGTKVQGSIYAQKKLNDRFTLNIGAQSENGSKDFSFAGRLQGRIN